MIVKYIEKKLFVEKRNVFSYPTKESFFNPSNQYPEYPFSGEISDISNEAYDMVRACLHAMQLDDCNYGTPLWNPLGEIIKPGNNILLKPNLVCHTNKKDSALGIECVITHPSIVRAIADYCIIALNSTGSITIGDAPLQSCDFEMLINQTGYVDIVNFYHKYGVDVSLIDFRLVKSKYVNIMGVNVVDYSNNKQNSDEQKYFAVNLGKYSLHRKKREHYKNYRVTNYDPKKMNEHHNLEKNEYLIPQSVLNADVVINFPKPKTHRKAGITAAMKNLIGINGHKDWLPHHIRGSVSEGGDEYKEKSIIKNIVTSITEKADIAALNKKNAMSYLYRILSSAIWVIGSITFKDKYAEGSWYGNDTIWRTVCDLNRILKYANKKGILEHNLQRQLFQVADMIISGEGEGPLAPTPKSVGIVATSINPAVLDIGICALMGMDWKKVPNINGAFGIKDFPITDCLPEEVMIISNEKNWNEMYAINITKEVSLTYEPTKGWKNNIELEK